MYEFTSFCYVSALVGLSQIVIIALNLPKNKKQDLFLNERFIVVDLLKVLL